MTVSSEIRKAGPYEGNDVTTSFPFSFKVFKAEDLLIVHADRTGAESVLVLNSDYTVTLAPDQNTSPGGTVVLSTALGTGTTLTIASRLQNLQPVDLTNQGGFYPRVINDALDRLTILVQQLAERVSRSLKMAISMPPGVETQLPAPIAGTLLGWNAQETALENVNRSDAALYEYSQGGIGAVRRSVESKLRESVSVKDFGAVGDGVADDTEQIQYAINAAAGKVLLLGADENYLFDPDVGLTISSPIKIVSNGSKFIKATPSDTTAFVIASDNVVIDRLSVDFVGSGGSQAAERGIQIDGSNIDIGSIVLNAATVGTGADSSLRTAVTVGNRNGIERKKIQIGSITTINWDRPVEFSNIQNSVVGFVDVKNYVRGIYIRDCRSLTINGGFIRSISSNSKGGAGENGILIESVAAKYSTQDIHINHFAVEDSGEHGYRLGGKLSMRNIWFSDCRSLRSGSSITVANPAATEWHGGCGFKAQGGTEVAGQRHENIYFDNCVAEDCNIAPGVFPAGHGYGNFSGFQIVVCSYVHLSNCVVRKRDQTYSAGRAVELLSSDHVTFDGCDFMDAAQSGVRIYEVGPSDINAGWKFGCEFINFVGGTINGYESPFRLEDYNYIHKNITLHGVNITGGAPYAIRVEVPTGAGDVIDAFFNYVHSNPTTVSPTGHPVYGTNKIKLSCVAAWNKTASSFPQAANGSSWTDAELGTIRVKTNDSWRQLISSENIGQNATTTTLANISSEINSVNMKIQGALVWNSTNGKLFRSMGSTPEAEWRSVDGATTITPV